MLDCRQQEDWVYVCKSKEIDIWKIESKSEENSSITVRGEGIINVHPSICMR